MTKPKVTHTDKLTLWYALADGEWHKAKYLAKRIINIPQKDGIMMMHALGNTRIIRAICEAEPDCFISTQKGYKRADKATIEELENARNDLISRAKKILARAEGVERVIAKRQQPELKVIK
jgi:hypothetical protein